MPLFFFHVRDGEDIVDREGTELPGLHEAKLCAVRYAGELLTTGPARFWHGDDWEMRVCDERGLTLFTLNFCISIAPALHDIRV